MILKIVRDLVENLCECIRLMQLHLHTTLHVYDCRTHLLMENGLFGSRTTTKWRLSFTSVQLTSEIVTRWLPASKLTMKFPKPGKKCISDTEEKREAGKKLHAMTYPKRADFGWIHFIAAPATRVGDGRNQTRSSHKSVVKHWLRCLAPHSLAPSMNHWGLAAEAAEGRTTMSASYCRPDGSLHDSAIVVICDLK